MIPELWHYEFKLRKNRLDTQHHKDFTTAEIDSLCQNAELMWISRQYTGNNPSKTAAETTQIRYDNLSSITVKYPVQAQLTPDVSTDGEIFEFALSNLTYDYLHMMDVEGKIEGCTKPVIIKIVQHDDYKKYKGDPYKGPSMSPFPRLIGNYGMSSQSAGRSLFVYSDGTFNVEWIRPEYIKRPTPVALGGYNDILGNPVSRVESELPEEYHSQIIDIAVDEARRILEEIQEFQLSSQKHLVNE